MPDYKLIFRNGPPGYADTDEENIRVENEEDLAAAVRKACRSYSYIRRVFVFRDDGYDLTPVNAAHHIINGRVERLSLKAQVYDQ